MTAEFDLLDWIRRHKVCWDMLPYFVMSPRGKTQVGFELDLYAQIEAGLRFDPGSKECETIFRNLAEVARMVLPTDQRPTRYDVGQFDGSFHLRSETKMLPEVQLTVLIVHRTGYFNPVDPCELRCVQEIQQRLQDIGVQRKVWAHRQQHSVL